MTIAIDLAQALRELPQEAPANSLWPELQSQLPKTASWPKWSMAVAASAAAMVLLLQFKGAGIADLRSPNTQTAGLSELSAIMDRSAQLESIYYSAQDDGISSAALIAANLEIEDRLDAIDSHLADQPENPELLPLWQERVDLLDQGIALNQTNAEYNRNDRSFDLALASLN
jgi:hypothetical protein